ncbi:hypothetical protein T484DRAFT_1846797, partial [Baffinella frigidus]
VLGPEGDETEDATADADDAPNLSTHAHVLGPEGDETEDATADADDAPAAEPGGWASFDGEEGSDVEEEEEEEEVAAPTATAGDEATGAGSVFAPGGWANFSDGSQNGSAADGPASARSVGPASGGVLENKNIVKVAGVPAANKNIDKVSLCLARVKKAAGQSGSSWLDDDDSEEERAESLYSSWSSWLDDDDSEEEIEEQPSEKGLDEDDSEDESEEQSHPNDYFPKIRF